MARQRRLVDQSASMQAALRDWDRAVGTGLVCLVLIGSVVALAFAFAGGDEPVTLLGVRARRATWLGWLAVGTFAVTLLELVLDPRGAARRRADAVKALAALKGEYRSVTEPVGATEAARLTERYGEVMAAVPEVPNVMFNKLKAAHLRKVEVSRILSERPGLSSGQARRALRRHAKTQRGRPA